MSGNDTKKVRKERCPRGTRKNPKTGVCEKIVPKGPVAPLAFSPVEELVLSPIQERVIPSPIQEPVIPSLIQEPLTPSPIQEPVIPSPIQEPLTPSPIQEPVIPSPIQEPVIPQIESNTYSDIEEEMVKSPESGLSVIIPGINKKTGKTKRCPNGYAYNKKTGFCIRKKTRKALPLQPQVKVIPIETHKAPVEPATAHKAPVQEPAKDLGEFLLSGIDESSNEYLSKKEKAEYDTTPTYELGFLYPDLNDPLFSLKIAQRKEFFQTKYDGTIRDIRAHAELMCNAEFEILPHQLFVKNFLSFQTPYNSLLLYHGLGTGKTCSSIGIAEEMRSYMKQLGIKQRIIVVASPTVQSNYRLQLFDERKLKKMPNPNIQPGAITNIDDNIWNIDSCIGNSLLKEINPANLRGLTREKVISQINSIINNYYVFMGYGQLANFIQEKTTVPADSGYNDKEIAQLELKYMKKYFNNRLIIIDEVHNIRITDENKHKRAAMLLMKLAKHTDNMRLLLLSATPMYNSHKEIIWLCNLMNLNDKRSILETSTVFDKEGEFKHANPETNFEGGREMLSRKLTGYVSYVRGENPYVFPYRIYPNQFALEHALTSHKYPTMQMNGKAIDEPIKHIKPYINYTSDYQKDCYMVIIENLMRKSFQYYTMYGEMRNMPSFENMESFGYTLLQVPLESLNIVFPNPKMDKLIEQGDFKSYTNEATNAKDVTDIIASSVGSEGLHNIITYEEVTKPTPMRQNYEYKPDVLKKYGAIFKEENLVKYSAKIANIISAIKNSTGIVIIYSQYIDGGIIPIALALEELGFSRYSSNRAYSKSLFKKRRVDPIDALTMKPRVEGEQFNPAQYIMITGEKSISPSNAADVKYATNPDNKNGEKVRVILISKAGSEGIDFKNIRQIHIMEPWYNMNRIEQIIGRGVRNLSHCQLPFEQRNVEIYLHSTLFEGSDEEAADLYVYRLAERKAIQIGKVTRLLKESSVDCILNLSQTNFSAENLMKIAENQNIKLRLSSGKDIDFRIGDQQFTDICDYMDTCEYKCKAGVLPAESDLIQNTYVTDFIKTNNDEIIKRIRALFREHSMYKRNVLIDSINIVKQYPIDQIFYAITYLVNNKNEFLTDKYGRSGYLVNRDIYYLFQPIEITDENSSIYERTSPVEYKRNSILLELPKEINKDIAKEVIEPSEEAPKKAEEPSETSESIFANIKTKYQTVFGPRAVIKTAEKNWYKHANHIIDHLITVYNISIENLHKHVIYHILDLMVFSNKMELIKTIYSESDTEYTNENYTDILPHIKRYFDSRRLMNNGRVAILLSKENSWKLYLKPDLEDDYEDEDIGSSNESGWKEGEPEDYRIFAKEIDVFDVEDSNINTIVGFINMFKTREMVFKTKDVRQARNNVGARCGDSTTKADVIKSLNLLLESNFYDESTQIFHFGLCAIMECLMREFTDIGYKGRVYFLTPEQTAINDIARYSRKP